MAPAVWAACDSPEEGAAAFRMYRRLFDTDDLAVDELAVIQEQPSAHKEAGHSNRLRRAVNVVENYNVMRQAR